MKGVEFLNTPLMIDTYLPPIENNPGISHPAKIIASDGKTYFLKGNMSKNNNNNKLFYMDAALAQEALSYRIANFFNIPTPQIVYIKITEDDLVNFPKLRFVHNFQKPGLYLASENTGSSELNKEFQQYYYFYSHGFPGNYFHGFLSRIQNKEDISKIIYFDILIANIDRYKNSGNLIFKDVGDGNIMLAIDFGYSFFGPYWSAHEYYPNIKKEELLHHKYPNGLATSWPQFILQEMDLLGQQSYNSIFDALSKFMVFKENPFLKSNHRAHELTNNILTKLINEIPNEWFVQGEYQKNMYLQFISSQIKLMPSIIDYLVSAKNLNNLNGGKLKWETGKNIISL